MTKQVKKVKSEKIIILSKKLQHPVINYRITMIIVAGVSYLALNILVWGLRRAHRPWGLLQPWLHGKVGEFETAENKKWWFMMWWMWWPWGRKMSKQEVSKLKSKLKSRK